MHPFGFRFQHSYQELPEIYFSRQHPTPVSHPQLLIYNHRLAQELGLHPIQINDPNAAAFFSGNTVYEGSQPIAQAYAGHQFGYFNQLGDGRAILLGEHVTPSGQRVDVQLKGAGRTPYSRRGDGRAAIGPMLREYLISEAMYALGIPTTRSLAVVLTGETILRDGYQPSAILTRIAASHLRFGTFEFAAAFSSLPDGLKLLDYAIQRHYPRIARKEDKVLAFLEQIMQQLVSLIAHWMRVGFIHGVMNTDNMSIAGETIDYGPCAFMEHYHTQIRFSFIDKGGRYAYAKQPSIAHWNFQRLVEALPYEKTPERVRLLQAIVEQFGHNMQTQWLQMMLKKIGIAEPISGDSELVIELLDWMQDQRADYTNTFLVLCQAYPDTQLIYQSTLFTQWKERWQQRLKHQGIPLSQAYTLMRSVNPTVIPRNHLVEKVLQAAEKGDIQPLEEWLKILQSPYTTPASGSYQTPATSHETVPYTYCGT